ncbi:MAG TPA: MgtC/SapB family protein [Vicinamibacterales bacterium]|jgi:uncharacterized membrane protein (DUF4010 family)
MSFDSAAFWNIAAALLGGLAVGIERQWSGHAFGPRARFAGIRTFTLLGLVAGLSGWLWVAGLQGPAVVFLAGLGALVVIAYLSASRTDVDGTTEVAAFVVLAAGLMAGAGLRTVASAIVAITVLLLFEKKGLHRLVSKLDRVELQAGARFAVMAAVILPLLPEGPYGPGAGIKPRQLWMLVLLFSGISFVGYIARRAVGRAHGYAVAGTLGGMISSTSTTLALSRLSQEKKTAGPSMAAGALGASVVLFPRVLIAAAVLSPALARAVWPLFIAPVVIGAALVGYGVRHSEDARAIGKHRNPLQFRAALQMALLFQAVLFLMTFMSRYGPQGLYPSAALLGLTDVDALTVSMSRLASGETGAGVAAKALTIGILSNTLVKMGIALAIGRGVFRLQAAAGLAIMAAALGIAVIFF